MAPVLGYWKLRGLCQSIRLMLEYGEDEYEEKMYQFGPGPDFDKSEWLNEKFNLGLTLPNLPYYIDGDIKITQSNAVLRHVARKHDLCGATEQEKVKVDILENQAMDLRMKYVPLVYANYNKDLKQYLVNLKVTLKAMSEVLGSQSWLVGDKVTLPDFLYYELFDIHRILEPSCLEDFPNLVAYMKRFEELPQIKKYMASPRFMKAPLNGPMALFGGK